MQGESPDYDAAGRCVECGSQRESGDWPWCPHDRDGKYGHTPFQSYIDPHLLPYKDPRAHETEFNERLGRMVTGVRVTSREQRRRLMKETNTEWAPRPQGEGAEF